MVKKHYMKIHMNKKGFLIGFMLFLIAVIALAPAALYTGTKIAEKT